MLFYLFSSLALVSAIIVIRTKNPVYSVLFLILVFANVTALLILEGLDFLAMVFIVVYVGAIAVLFLFVVMMLNINLAEMSENMVRYLPVGGLILILSLFQILLIVESELIPPLFPFKIFQTDLLLSWFSNLQESLNAPLKENLTILYNIAPWHFVEPNLRPVSGINCFLMSQQDISNIQAIGLVLFSTHWFYLMLGGLILLVAMIGTILLTMDKNKMKN
uniref:NADH-ubiquinone oxidoreductase chain 6 n=1 Tax=Mesostigma viride TaxID=41882 RepID=Q8W9S8_MESVI|nr:NADH dehydrogenase subunit 6 [Mesostigma viride]AAL36731.1 NADH dehydrogenase subunit 6 [Mesostigma viride]